MDMKKILQAMNGAKAKAEVNSSDMRKFLRVVSEAELNQSAALPAAPKFSITQTTYDSLNEPPDFTVTNIERGVEVASFDSEQEARAYVAQQDPAGAPQTELHQMQSKATAPEANPDAAPQQAVAEEVPNAQQSPEQIAYNQLRAQLDSADSLRGGGGSNTYAAVSPEVTASTNAMKQKLAQMAAALKAKGIDAEAEYNAPDASVPAAAPVDLNKYNDQDAAPVAEEVGMSRLLSIITEGKGPLNRPTAAETLTMQHFAETKKTITNPVLNVQEGATPSMIGKYFKAVEQELNEAAERSKDRSRQLAERVSTKINELSTDTLASYKKKAGADASKADKEGNFKRGDKRFSGIVKATKKELDNDVKKHAMSEDLEELLDLRNKVEEAIKQRLDPKCWKGKKIGNPKTKIKGGVRVNNCVPKEAVNPAQQAAIAIAKKKAGKK